MPRTERNRIAAKAGKFLIGGPAEAKLAIVLAHGAGAPMDSPFMNAIATGLAAGGFRVVRFEFPYMRARREGGKRGAPDREPLLLQAWRDAINDLGVGTPPVIGGKSLGGRTASMVADEMGVRGLVCLGYPFHPPGKPVGSTPRRMFLPGFASRPRTGLNMTDDGATASGDHGNRGGQPDRARRPRDLDRRRARREDRPLGDLHGSGGGASPRRRVGAGPSPSELAPRTCADLCRKHRSRPR